jgi:hypothetical protein
MRKVLAAGVAAVLSASLMGSAWAQQMQPLPGGRAGGGGPQMQAVPRGGGPQMQSLPRLGGPGAPMAGAGGGPRFRQGVGGPGGFREGGFRGGNGGFRGGDGRFGDGRRWHHRGDRGAAIGAGIAGLAAGAAIGGALASPGYDSGYDYGPGYDSGYGQEVYDAPAVAPAVGGDDEAYCESRYKSYDPSTGTYLGYDGERHPCP